MYVPSPAVPASDTTGGAPSPRASPTWLASPSVVLASIPPPWPPLLSLPPPEEPVDPEAPVAEPPAPPPPVPEAVVDTLVLVVAGPGGPWDSSEPQAATNAATAQ